MITKIKNFIRNIIISIYIFLYRLNIKNSEEKVSEQGSFTVAGHGEVIIPLKKNPKEVFLHFAKEEWATCNPHHHHHDKLHWKILHKHPNHKHSDYVLEVSWEVHDVRIIKYLIKY